MSSPRPRSDNPGSGTARPAQTGATAATPTDRRRKPWWLWALFALVILAILLISLTRCGPDNTSSNAPASSVPRAAPSAVGPAPNTAPVGPPSAAAPSAGTGAGAAGGGGQGALTADGTSLLPLGQVGGSDGDLTSLVGKTVSARGVLVQSVPTDEGFWVGDSDTDRIWVQLNGDGESGYTVKQGDRIDFTGRMIAHDPAFAGQVGVDAAEGADQLTQEAAHIAVDKSAVALHTT